MESSTSRVAILAIHGVADQQPCTTSRRIADLLLSLNGAAVTYAGFKETPLRVGVQGLSATPLPLPSCEERAFQLDPRSPTLKHVHTAQRSAQQPSSTATPSEANAPGLDISQMDDQVLGYVPSEQEAIYETVQLSTVRAASSSGKADGCEVHLHELYWADLSRASTTFLRLILEFYQLLFHTCELGRVTLDFARAHYGANRAWAALSWFQLAAERCLVMVVPVLNLCLLGLSSVLLAYHLPLKAQVPAVTALVGLGAAVVTGYLLYHFRFTGAPKRWPLRLIWVMTSGGVLGGLCFWLARGRPLFLFLALLAWAVAAALILWLLRIYQRRQPGAFLFGLIWVVLVTVIYVGALVFRDNSPAGVLSAGLRTAEWTLIALVGTWALYSLTALAATMAGWVAVRKIPNPERPSASRVNWTVQLTLTLPGLITALLNLVLWKALYLTADKIHWESWFGGEFFFPLEPYEPIPWLRGVLGLTPETSVRAHDFASALIDATASPPFAAGFFLALLAVLWTAWSLLPAVLAESDRTKSTPDKVKWLGQYLSDAFRSLRGAGEVMRWLIIVGIPLAYLVTLFTYQKGWYQDGRRLASWGLTMMGAGAILIVSSKGFFRALALGFRAGLDIAMDVANWLRLHPKGATPRARISARFVSFLRYLLEWRDARDGRAYDAIVIVAHSQGTVIAAEVLRYLKQKQLLAPPSMPIYLFTMGCPLRQLYALRFPHQYAWACRPNTEWPASAPDPAELLGVRRWVNAYRSGDYVGRYLWFSDDDAKRWSAEPLQTNDRSEFCVGIGAHNHYWDSITIGAQLDQLIVEGALRKK